MRLHRYIAKLSVSRFAEGENEFLGTWVGFAALILISVSATYLNYGEFRGQFGGIALLTGFMYFFYWLSIRHNIFLYFIAVFSAILSFGLAGILIFQGNFSFTSALFSGYFFSIFLISSYYVIKNRSHAA